MHDKLLQWLRCPQTGEPLELADAKRDGRGRIASGRLTTASGAHTYPIHDYVPRFVQSDRYVTTFSTQRKHMRRRFAEWKAETGREALFEKTTSVAPAALAGQLVLDAGAGYGRFTHTMAAAGAEVIAVDLSTDSINLLQQYVGDRDNVHVIQADLHRLLLQQDLVDLAFSIGVLHHTPDTRTSFEALQRVIKPGGRCAVWVYHPRDKRHDDIWRRFTTRMPKKALYYLCLVRAPVYTGIHLVRHGTRDHRDFWPSVMGHFDSLAPRYAYSHTHREVVGWFEAQGHEQICPLERRTAVTGVRST